MSEHPEEQQAAPEIEECCPGGPPELGETDTAAADALALFSNFMKAANQPGLIDARAKKLIAIALSVVQHCEPCLKIHIKSALSMGITFEEIDEAANLAIAFGGCTAMMFYKENSAAPRREAERAARS